MFQLTLRRLGVVIAGLTLAASFVFHPLKPAYACSCVAPPPPQEALGQAQAVFAGTARSVVPAPNGVLVTFEVEQIWKGPEGGQFTLATPGSSAACGFEFVEGERYLVYGVAQDGQLSTNLCTRTALLASAGDDLAALGEGGAVEPAPVAEPAPVSAGQPWLPVALGIGGVAVAIVAAVAVARRRTV